MFFQPPPGPKFWTENVTKQQVADHSNINKTQRTTILENGGNSQQQTNSVDGSSSSSFINGGGGKSDIITNNIINQKIPFETVYQQQTASSPSLLGQANNKGKQSGSPLPNNNSPVGGSGYRKATIIATATTTQMKGHNRQGQPSPYQRIKSVSTSGGSLSSFSYPLSNNRKHYYFLDTILITTLRLEHALYIATFVLILYVNHAVTFYFI